MSETLPDGPPQGEWTVEDYRSLERPDDFELLDGELHPLPAPDPATRQTTSALGDGLRAHAESRELGALRGPRPSVELGSDTVVRPELVYVAADRADSIVEGDTVTGAPELVVEVLTEETRRVQLLDKRERYEEVGVDWLLYVEPRARAIEICRREEGRLSTDELVADDAVLALDLFPEFELELSEIWAVAG